MKLADAQLVIAREHGFGSWPKFSAHLQALRQAQPDAWTDHIPAGEVELPVEISGRRDARALVLFALAGNVGRDDAGIRQIAAALHGASFCTVLADLLTQDEVKADAIEERCFDIPLLASRLGVVMDRFAADAAFRALRMGLFAAGTGAAAAVIAGRQRSTAFHALVSCAGRPDLGGSGLAYTVAPSLFICGGDDAVGHGFTRTLLPILPRGVPRRLDVIDGAGARFEAGAQAGRAAALASEWFERYLCGGDAGVAEVRP
jgi:putative phosphoribosyl transferase